MGGQGAVVDKDDGFGMASNLAVDCAVEPAQVVVESCCDIDHS